MICCTVVMLSSSARLHSFLRALYIYKVENGLMGENNMAIGFFVPLVCFIVVAAFAANVIRK